MWPWEHLAVAYLGYSLLVRLWAGHAPRSWPVVALVVGTQFPDFVDKPLAWTLGLLPTGHSLAHSLFVAVPASALAVALAWRHGRRSVGTAFAFGYLAHLLGDVFYPLVLGGPPNAGFLFWPVVPAVEVGPRPGFVEMVRYLFEQYLRELARGTISPYLAGEIGLLGSAFLLWVADGVPPLRSLWSRFRVGLGTEEVP